MSRSIIITSGNASLGFEAARELAADRSTLVVVACHDPALGKHAVEQPKAMGGNAALRTLQILEGSKTI